MLQSRNDHRPRPLWQYISIMLVCPLGVAGLIVLIGPAAAGGGPPAPACRAETIRVATYNIEHMSKMLNVALVKPNNRTREQWADFFSDEEDCYEVAWVITQAAAAPDILLIQEGCSQDELEHFNTHWLRQAYAYVKVFRGNSPRGQHLGILAKKGFEPLEVREFADEVDPVDDPALRKLKEGGGLAEKNLLFSRGPAFVKFRTPGGHVMWVGNTHVKSKYGNSLPVVKWRIREMQRTREICGELLARGDTPYLLLGGDFNDDMQLDEFEKTLGRDALSVITGGQDREQLTNLTSPLIRANPRGGTYHARVKTKYPAAWFDYLFASPDLARHVRRTTLIDAPLAGVASDHLPVVTEIALPGRKP
ncbi:MAG: endonuclease/exonuclease/phosphatase family protein [Phycisphaerae bacterium]|nr:endonuclease/exonuclease/phosphatase family protein [Phycisphaerae bacterium]